MTTYTVTDWRGQPILTTTDRTAALGAAEAEAKQRGELVHVDAENEVEPSRSVNAQGHWSVSLPSADDED